MTSGCLALDDLSTYGSIRVFPCERIDGNRKIRCRCTGEDIYEELFTGVDDERTFIFDSGERDLNSVLNTLGKSCILVIADIQCPEYVGQCRRVSVTENGNASDSPCTSGGRTADSEDAGRTWAITRITVLRSEEK